MAQGVVVDVSARITGYEQSLAHLKNALSKLDPGSSLARSLSKGLAAAESQIKSLGKNLTPKFTNDAQLDRFVDKFNNIGNIIQDVSQKMQNISAQDLNFEDADESIRQLITRLSELQAELESNINKGIQNTINSSQELSKVFNNLDIDIKDKNPGEIFEALARKAEESAGKVDIASKELVKAQENLAKKQASLSKAESSPINNKEVLQNELQELTSSYTRALETIKQQVTGGLTAMLGADNPQLDKIATAFLGGLTPENLRERLKTLKDSVTAELKNGLSAKDIYTSLFGDLGKGGNAQAVNTAIIARMFPNMGELKAQFDQKINEISTDLTKNQVGTIKELISESDIETALERTLKAIDGAYRKIQGAIAQGQQEVSQAATVRDTAQSNLNAAQAEADQIERTVSSLAQEVERVKAENQNLRNEIEQLKQNIENDKAAKAEEVKGLAANAARGADQWKITTEAANQYSEALEKVHQREQLVGKIEGIVQRWFSIYAAVRMVGNAIRSIISTIKELDKTITDITIVTNMSREDLWGQMPTYTKMAQDYAVSISGVYQVSQLFYQQGLQTNDVLTLTGETLKMARIAGLDYGEATNYMTNALRSFKMEMDEASRVTDVYSVLAASAAVSVSEIAEAMSKTASSAYAVGASLENTATMITVMTEATRESATNIGSALKSIISRYGEMTSDPAKLVDSEGEEMSLNKVDRALQSVGITLQDAQGQFRNFDDVIAELAATWNTLDNNTQRYIATVMAGNRQQSRFLALVSSYDRYAELSEKAANAAGAGQEQFEKTLEGIEARTQQLQTSLQNLYTSAGLEDLYGALLGIGSGILDYYNKISSAVGGGILGASAAVATFAGQFANLALIVTNVFKIIKQNAKIEEQLFTNTYEAEVTKRVNERIKAEQLADAEIERIRTEVQERMTAREIRDIRKVAQERSKSAKLTGKQIGGLITSGLSTAAMGIASSDLFKDNQVAQGGLTTLSGVLGGVSSGLMVGGPIGALVGVLTTLPSVIPGIIQLFNGLSKETDNYTEALNRNQQAQEEYQKAQQKSRQQQNIVTSLESELKKLNELEDSRFDSAESYDAYRIAMNELVEAYPGLIQYYDEEGNAIAIAREEREKYLEQQKELAKIAKREELSKQFNIDQDIIALERQGFVEPVLGSWNDDETKETYQTILRDLRKYKTASPDFSEGILDLWLKDYGLDSEVSFSTQEYIKASRRMLSAYGYTTERDLAEVFGYKRTDSYDSNKEIANAMRSAGFDVTSNSENSIRESLYKYSTQAIEKAQKNNENVVDAYDVFMREIFGAAYKADNSVMRSILVGIDTQSRRQDWEGDNEQTRKQIIRDWEQNEGLYSTTMEKNAFTELTYNAFEEYLNNLKKTDTSFSEQSIGNYWNDFINNWKPDFSEYYNKAEPETIQRINEIYKNIDQYTEEEINNYIEQFKLDASQGAGKDLRDTWKKRQGELINALNEYGKDVLDPAQIKYISENYSLALLQSMLNGIPIIRKVAKDSANEFAQDWISIFDIISQISDESTRNKIIQLINDKGIDSISGIFAIIDALPDFEGKSNLIELLQVLTGYIVPNFVIEFDSMTDTLTSNFEELTKAISNSQKGMDLSDAIKMADSLGVSISDFDKRGNQYFYTDYMRLVDEYLGSQEEIAKYLEANFIVNEDNTAEYEAYKRAVAAREQYYRSAREAYLAEGRIADFLKSFEGIDIDENTVRAMLAAGTVPEELAEYSTELIQWYNSIGDDIYKAFMDSLSGGEATEIKVTATNKNLLEQYVKFVQGEIIEGKTVFVSLAQATAEELKAFYDNILIDAAISPKEKDSYLKSLDDEIISRNKANVLKEVTNSYASFDRTLATRYAEAFGLSIDELDFNETTRTFSVTLAQLQEQLNKVISEGADAETVAELQDAIRSIRKDIGNLIASGLKGTLTNAEKFNLIDLTQSWNIDLTFQETNEGLQLSRDSAIALYAELLKIDSVAANIVFTNLKEQFTEVGEACENISSTMSSIARLEQEIKSNTNGTNKELENRLDIYKRIAAEQMNDPNSYQFMNRSLPNGMQSPVNYWESAYSMRETMVAAAENGNIGVQDFYNIVNEMNYWASLGAENISFMGENLDGSMTSAAALIEKGMRALKVVDGKTVVDFESFGINFANGADEMATGVDSGIEEFANSQIKILDSLINYLETIVAMEQLSETGEINWQAPLFGENGELTDEGIANAQKMHELATIVDESSGELTAASQTFQNTLREYQLWDGMTLWDALGAISVNSAQVGEWSDEQVALIKAAYAEIVAKVYADYNANDFPKLIEMLFGKTSTDGTTPEIPQQQLDLVLNFSGNGKIEDAEKFASMVQQFLEIDGTGNVTIQGESADATFTLDIQNNGATATLTWSDGKIDTYNLETDGNLYDWLKGKTLVFAQRNHLTNLAPIKLTTQKVSVSNKDSETNIEISINYTNDEKTTGSVKVGTEERNFGPGTDFATAGAALQDAAEAYNLKVGSGTLYDIPLDSKHITVTAANGVEYKFSVLPEGTTLDDIGLQWAQVEEDVKVAIEKAEGSGITKFGDVAVTKNGNKWTAEISDINIDGTSTIRYRFELEPQNLSNEEAWATEVENILSAKETYGSHLSNLAERLGISNFDLTKTGVQSGRLGVLMSVDGKSVVNVTYDIEWGNGVTPEQAASKIDEYRARLEELKNKVTQFEEDYSSSETEPTSTANNPIKVFPDAIYYDVSKEIRFTDEGYRIYDSEGKLLKSNKFTNAEEAIQDVLNNSKPITGSDSQRYRGQEAEARAATIRKQLSSAGSQVNQVATKTIKDQARIEAAELARRKEYDEAILSTFKITKEDLMNVGFDSIISQMAGQEYNDTPTEELKDTVAKQYAIDEKTLSKITTFEQLLSAIAESLKLRESGEGTGGGQGGPGGHGGLADYYGDLNRTTVYKTGSNTEEVKTADLRDLVEGVKNGTVELSEATRAIEQYAEFNNQKYNFSGQGKGAGSKDPTVNALQQMASASENSANSTGLITNAIPSITSALDSNVAAVQSILPAIPEEPKATDWYSVFDGISVHGDFWGEGNQIVMSDGNGGNIHMNLKDYIAQFNQSLIEMQEMANNNPVNVDINANNAPFISKLQDAINRANRSSATVKVKSEIDGPLNADTKAKGNVALGKGTLMGELGAELYVTGGHYYIAGQNGAEFVDLPDDAIVFNHLQTKRLLGTGSTGRGRAVINEKKATSYATGNVAMASASDTLAVLKNIKAMWEQLANLSFKDLATKGGGSGGGGGKEGLDKGFIADLERWYNLLRQIDKLEKDINYEEKLRSKIQSDRVINGAAIYESQKRSLEMLEQEISAHRELATLQESYYDLRRKEFEQTGYSRIFKFTEQGLMQYNDEDVAKDSNLVGLFSLARLNALDANNQPVYTSKQQYNMLQEMGFGSDLLYTAEGEAIDVSEDDGYAKAVEAFWDKLEGWKDELDGLYDSYREQLDAVLDNETERNKLMQEIVDNQRSVEDKVLEAIENREQTTIDKLQEQTDALRDASDRYIDGLNNQLNKERQMYQQQESQEDLRKLRRQLAILERSGGSGSQIANLRAQIAEQEQDQYFDAQQQQIDTIKEASDLQLERLDHQIEIMTETLAYQKENGLLWGEVYEVMARNPQEIVSFITEHSPEWSSQSTLAQSEELKELSNIVSQWSAYYKDKQEGKDVVDTGTSDFDWNSFAPKAAELYKQIWDENKETARKLFDATYKETGDPNAAWKAVTNYLNPLMSAYKTAHPEEFNPQILPVGTGDSSASSSGSTSKASTDDLYYYVNKNGQIMRATKSWASNNKMPESPVSKDYATVSNWLKNQSGHGWQVNYNGMTYRANTTDRTAAETLLMNQLLAAGLSSTERDRAMSTLKKYKQGGLNDYTGLAMLHGTKTRPEGIINAEQTRVLREDILSNKPDSLLSQLQFLHDLWTNTATSSGALNNNNNIIIEKAEVNMNVDSIANDYDAQRAGEQALEQMLAIARKTSVQNLRR